MSGLYVLAIIDNPIPTESPPIVPWIKRTKINIFGFVICVEIRSKTINPINNNLTAFLHSTFLTIKVAIKAPKAAPYLFALTIKPAISLSTPKPSTKADKNAPPRFT